MSIVRIMRDAGQLRIARTDWTARGNRGWHEISVADAYLALRLRVILRTAWYLVRLRHSVVPGSTMSRNGKRGPNGNEHG